MTITVVPITEAYIDGYNACLTSVALERRWLGFVEPADLERSRRFVQHNLAEGNPHVVALDGDQVVGWCDITRDELEGFQHAGTLGMGVQKQYRGQGIGERLARAALQQAQAAGLERVDLDVFASNHAAIKLYEKLGFVAEGFHPRARKLDGQYDDLISMALIFDAPVADPGQEDTP